MRFIQFFFISTLFSLGTHAVTLEIKYRDKPVNVTKNRFEYFKKRSSLINESWYDKNNDYLILNILGTNYHHCGFIRTDWNHFKNAESLGQHYNRYIVK